MGPALDRTIILATLREISCRVTTPVWLFGGVAVDFLAGRWTRLHSDVDLNTFWDTRERLTAELAALGYKTSDREWLTFWSQPSTGRQIELVFLERSAGGTPILNIPANSSIGTPGCYHLLPGYMDPTRFATLDGVRFRVCSPEGEWLGRSQSVIAGRPNEPKIEHDRALLETMISPSELARLRAMIPVSGANQKTSASFAPVANTVVKNVGPTGTVVHLPR